MHSESQSGSHVKADAVLKEWDIRPTPVRVLILRVLLESKRPVSALEIENLLQTVDRSSITRTLSTFAEAHLIHPISDGSGAMRYELCRESSSNNHTDEHAHFHCRKCGKTYCLPELQLSIPAIPEGYEGESITYIITGLCPTCR
ncbi:MAG: transcriptional repressor [Muribaculaceae bacterium]|nr:transcriptional repressor [Muribaculaceae bacterium]